MGFGQRQKAAFACERLEKLYSFSTQFEPESYLPVVIAKKRSPSNFVLLRGACLANVATTCVQSDAQSAITIPHREYVSNYSNSYELQNIWDLIRLWYRLSPYRIEIDLLQP